MKAHRFATSAGVLLVLTFSSFERTLAEQPQADSGRRVEALAGRSGCRRCHNPDSKRVGPAFQDIAAKYKTVAGARGTLIEKVKQGGKGNWTEVTGGVTMPPHSGLLSDTEISRLVDWILNR